MNIHQHPPLPQIPSNRDYKARGRGPFGGPGRPFMNICALPALAVVAQPLFDPVRAETWHLSSLGRNGTGRASKVSKEYICPCVYIYGHIDICVYIYIYIPWSLGLKPLWMALIPNYGRYGPLPLVTLDGLNPRIE